MKYTKNEFLIAEFMGLKPIKGSVDDCYFYYNIKEDSYGSLPCYDTWDDLMPVVEKIENFGGEEQEFYIFGKCVQLGDMEFVGDTKMQAVKDAIIWWITKYKF